MKFGYSPAKADSINSIVYILSAVASPIAGFFIDKTGKAIFWIISGIVFTLVAHAMFAFTFIPAYYGMVSYEYHYRLYTNSIFYYAVHIYVYM